MTKLPSQDELLAYYVRREGAMNPPPSPARNPDEECQASLQTVQTAMYPMLPRTTAELPPIPPLPQPQGDLP